MSGLARQLRWLIWIRLLAITSVALSYFLFQIMSPGVELPPSPDGPALPAPLPIDLEGGPTVDPLFLYVLALVTYGASVLYAWLLKRSRLPYTAQGHIQFLGDLILITALIWYFQEISNPFSLLYLIVVGGASILLRRQAGFTIATVAYILYATAVLDIYYGWFPGSTGVEEPSSPYIFLLAYNLVVHLVGFYAVALLTYHLVHRVTRAELELEEKREDLADLKVVHRDVIQSISSGLITTDLHGRITSINRAGQEILETGAGDLVGRYIHELDLFTRERWAELSSAATGQPEQLRAESEIDRGDYTAYIGFSISRLVDAEGVQKGHIVVFQDFTRWRRLEQQVRIKDRMAAIGELAAGLAHEIGNPLAAISGSVQMLSSSLDGKEQGKLLDILLKESQRLDRTIKGFLRFARPKERSNERFDIAELLTEDFELLRNSEEVSDAHELHLELDPPSATLLADPDQVSQIFWNLARNAVKAMPEGGRLEVTGRLEEEMYVLEVSDTGRGMTDEEKTNLFHPFQSFFDSGTGIGMAIVYRIVQEHGGDLAVSSRLGSGTTIRVELPRAGAPIEQLPSDGERRVSS